MLAVITGLDAFRTEEKKVMSSAPTQSMGRTMLLVAQLLTALLLLLIGIWLVVLFFIGVNGGVLLVIFAAVEIVLGLLSLAAWAALRSTRPNWVPRVAIVAAAFNAAVIAFAGIATISVTYPGGPVVLLILCNDVIIGELAVLYLLNRPAS